MRLVADPEIYMVVHRAGDGGGVSEDPNNAISMEIIIIIIIAFVDHKRHLCMWVELFYGQDEARLEQRAETG